MRRQQTYVDLFKKISHEIQMKTKSNMDHSEEATKKMMLPNCAQLSMSMQCQVTTPLTSHSLTYTRKIFHNQIHIHLRVQLKLPNMWYNH